MKIQKWLNNERLLILIKILKIFVSRTQDKIEKMKLYARAADCISIGDQVDKEIRSNSAWSLLPTQVKYVID